MSNTSPTKLARRQRNWVIFSSSLVILGVVTALSLLTLSLSLCLLLRTTKDPVIVLLLCIENQFEPGMIRQEITRVQFITLEQPSRAHYRRTMKSSWFFYSVCLFYHTDCTAQKNPPTLAVCDQINYWGFYMKLYTQTRNRCRNETKLTPKETVMVEGVFTIYDNSSNRAIWTEHRTIQWRIWCGPLKLFSCRVTMFTLADSFGAIFIIRSGNRALFLYLLRFIWHVNL